jgi:hypothetical protein
LLHGLWSDVCGLVPERHAIPKNGGGDVDKVFVPVVTCIYAIQQNPVLNRTDVYPPPGSVRGR